jgi:plastocyanin
MWTIAKNGWVWVALAALIGCSASSTSSSSSSSPSAPVESASASTAAVEIKLFQFNPASLTIAPGTTVTWTNQDDIHHTVNSGSPDKPGGPLDGTLPEKGSTYSYKFDQPGEYPYFCDYHNSMVGTIIVKQP